MSHLPQERLSTLPRLVSWLVIPTVLAMEFVDLRVGLSLKPALVSAYLIGFVLLTVLCLPFAARRLAELTAGGRLMVGAFGVLTLYALAWTLVEKVPVMQKGPAPRAYLIVPVITAITCLTAAVATLLAIPRQLRLQRLWWAGVAILAGSLVNWPRQVAATRSMRMATGMGGSSTYHVVLLLCLALFLGCALGGVRRRWSWALAAVSAVFDLLTGSRAALVGLAAFVVLLVIWLVARGGSRRTLAGLGAVVVLGAVAVVAIPQTQRMLLFSDSTRQTNLHTAVKVFTASPEHLVAGLGSGRLWPWYAFEAGVFPRPGAGLIRTAYGLALVSPHSLVLGVMVELGLVGLVLLVAVLACPVVAAVRGLTRAKDADADVVTTVVLLGVTAAMTAFVFDTYLLKNFGISYWWWLLALAAVGTRRGLRPTPED